MLFNFLFQYYKLILHSRWVIWVKQVMITALKYLLKATLQRQTAIICIFIILNFVVIIQEEKKVHLCFYVWECLCRWQGKVVWNVGTLSAALDELGIFFIIICSRSNKNQEGHIKPAIIPRRLFHSSRFRGVKMGGNGGKPSHFFHHYLRLVVGIVETLSAQSSLDKWMSANQNKKW